MRSATQPYCNTVEYGCVSLRMRFFSQNFGTIKRFYQGLRHRLTARVLGSRLDCNTVENGCFSLRMRFFPQNFGTIKRILPGSSSPSHREGPGTEVGKALV